MLTTRRILHSALPIDPFLLSLDDDYCRRVFLDATEGYLPGKILPRFSARQERDYQVWIDELWEVSAEDGWEAPEYPRERFERRSELEFRTADEAAAALPASDDEWAARIMETTFSADAWAMAAAS